MKVALCCIGRLENRYAVEYVEYYERLGFDRIFIYDNNYGDEEHFEDVLQDFINRDFVEIIDYRDKEVAQLQAYNDCYDKHGKEYDWIAFFDFDEFLHIVDGNNIKGDDLDIVENIIKEKFPDYLDAYNIFINQNNMFPTTCLS